MAAADRPRGIFVTGTDTGVGKTLFAAALARFLRERGIDAGVMKPVESGVENPSELGPDGRLLKWASGTTDDDALICPYRLRAPLAPSEAARRESVHIDFGHLGQVAQQLASKHEFLIVEGAGGLMVPLAGGLLVADLARDIGLPLLTVCRPGLGTINHTLLTLFAARTMEIPLAGFMINNMPKEPNDAEKGAPHALASLASADLLGVLDHVSASPEEQVEALAAQLNALPSLPWLLAALGI